MHQPESRAPAGYFAAVTLGLIGLLGTHSRASAAGDAATLFRETAPTVVMIEARNNDGIAQGSGVVVAPGLIVTNNHVVENAAGYVIVRQGSRAWRAEVDALDPDRDLALVSIVTKRAERFDLPIAKRRPMKTLRVGERVYAIGSPRGLEQTLSDGLVSGLPVVDETLSLVQTTAAISPGSSGGGLFDEKGQLIAITTLYLNDSQNLNFAIPADYINALERKLKPPSQEKIELPPPVASPAKAQAPPVAVKVSAAKVLQPDPIGRTRAVVLLAIGTGPVAEEGGLNENWILARAAGTLRNAGLAVFGSTQAAQKANVKAPVVLVSVGSMHIDDTVFFPWRLNVELIDYAEFSDGEVRRVTVWSDATHGYGGSGVVSGQVARAIDELVERLVRDIEKGRGPAPIKQ